MKDITIWENQLFSYKLVKKTTDITKETVQNFYLHLVKNINRLKGDIEFVYNKKNLVILEAAKKLILQYGVEKSNSSQRYL